MDWLRSQTRIFRALLYCYPAEFRHEYASEMESLFSSRLKAESSAVLWLETLADLAVSAPAEQWNVLASDLKHATRSLASVPGFSAIALFVIALGIGSTTSVFSVVNAVLLRSLPYGHPEQLVYLWEPNHNFKGVPDEMSPNVPDAYEWQRLNRSLDSIALFQPKAVNLISNGLARRVAAAHVLGSFFQTMQASPALGRALDLNDDRPGQESVAVISDALWRSQFGAALDVLGKSLTFDRRTYKVVGVMPKDFGFPFGGDVPYESSEFRQTDIWLPSAFTPMQKTDRVNFKSVDAVARLRPGVSAASAQADLTSIEARLQPLYPEMWRGWSVLVNPLVETIVGPVRQMLWLLLGAVALVLLISIANLANLLLARATSRAHELGIRSALGAERSRIIRHLLTESLLLSLVGGALGVAFAYAAVHLVVALNPGGIPRFDSASVDLRALVVAVLLSVATGALAGVAPAISASKQNVIELLRNAGSRIAGGSSSGRSALIVVEVALSVILLTASGLLIRSYLQLAALDPGFSLRALTFRINLDDRYNTPDLRTRFYKGLLDKLQQTPGVRFAGASTSTPLTDHESVTFAEIQGFGRSNEVVANYSVTPDYRKALGMPLLRGRDFDPRDSAAANTVLINERFAALYFPGRDPIGGHIRIGMGDLSKSGWLTVIGIAGNVRHMSLEEISKPQLFQPSEAGENFAVACAVPPSQVIASARATLHAMDSTLTLEGVHTMAQLVRKNSARRSFETALLSSFAFIALALAAAGLYGLMSHSAKQRTPEIGVRLAVGSSRAGVLALILMHGLRLTILGLFIGFASSLGLARLIGSFLFGVTAADPITLVAVPLVLLVVSCCACIIPAWSAARTDPLEALR